MNNYLRTVSVDRLLLLSRMNQSYSRRVNQELIDRLHQHLDIYIQDHNQFLQILEDEEGCIAGPVAMLYAFGTGTSALLAMVVILARGRVGRMYEFLTTEEGYEGREEAILTHLAAG